MAFWWVSQNKTFKEESEGGFLWAPKATAKGRALHHWDTMLDVRPGDVILSYVGQQILAVSVAKDVAYDAPRPFHSGEGIIWEKDGRRIEAEYQILDPPISIPKIRTRLLPLLPAKYSPLTAEGSGNQGYLFRLPDAAAELVLRDHKSAIPQSTDAILREIQRSPLSPTTKRALVESRIGQGQFRKDLIDWWDGKCAVTSLSVIPLLRASHMKPWKDSDNQERLDPYNGLLLAPSFDAAFDAGLISFAEDGVLLLSSKLDASALTALGIDSNSSLRTVNGKHRPYLAYHRAQVFKG